MDEFAKAIKVIKLKDERYGQYLTAGDDKVSVTLSIPGSKEWNQKNSEWRLEWLSGPKDLVGEVRLWSIYDKVLSFAKEPLNYMSKAPDDSLIQESWPVAAGAAAAEWRLEIHQRNNDPSLFANLVKMPHRGTKLTSEGLTLNANRPSTANAKKPKSKFGFTVLFRNPRLQWANNSNPWLIQVILPHSEFVEYDHPTTNISTPTRITNTYDDDPYQNKGPSTPEVSRSTPIKSISTPSEVSKSGPIKSISTPEVSRNTPIKSIGTPEVSPSGPIKSISAPEVSSDVIKSISDAYLCDSSNNNVFSRWQVGQVYLHVYQNSAGGHASYGYNNAQYCNSGGNVNGSGIQNNGDINVYNDINRSHDNNVKFINYH